MPVINKVSGVEGVIDYLKGPVAQLAEPPAHNRKVPGSSPGGPT